MEAEDDDGEEEEERITKFDPAATHDQVCAAIGLLEH